jgi:uncharacterized protein YuzB (UPF0349 family)
MKFECSGMDIGAWEFCISNLLSAAAKCLSDDPDCKIIEACKIVKTIAATLP